jgi:hypothetical protein
VTHCFSAYGGVNGRDFDPYDVRRQPIAREYSATAVRAMVEGWRVRGKRGASKSA